MGEVISSRANDVRSRGIMGGRYKLEVDGETRLYKGGIKNDFSYCLFRDTLVYITNLQGVNVTVPTKVYVDSNINIEASTSSFSNTNNMLLTVGASEFLNAIS